MYEGSSLSPTSTPMQCIASCLIKSHHLLLHNLNEKARQCEPKSSSFIFMYGIWKLPHNFIAPARENSLSLSLSPCRHFNASFFVPCRALPSLRTAFIIWSIAALPNYFDINWLQICTSAWNYENLIKVNQPKPGRQAGKLWTSLFLGFFRARGK